MIKPVKFQEIYSGLIPELSEAFKEFVLNGEYIGGSLVERFERKVAEQVGAAHVIGCKSGTHSLQLALLAAGIGPGDEVITVANTYYATAYAIRAVGAIPVFADVSHENGLLDPVDAEVRISSRTKAILPVHLYGVPADLDSLRGVCDRNGLFLVEDCSHAFGSIFKGVPIGAKSEFACFSLYPTKNLGAFGDAGMILTRSAEHAAKVRELIYLCDGDRTFFPPRAIHAMLDPLQAALLVVVLDAFPRLAQRRQKIAALYREKLSGLVRLLPQSGQQEIVPYVFPIFTERRGQLIRYLKDKGIIVQIHYDIDLHRLPQFGSLPVGSLPNTEKHNREVLSLSVHPSITDKEAVAVCEAVAKFIEKG